MKCSCGSGEDSTPNAERAMRQNVQTESLQRNEMKNKEKQCREGDETRRRK